jgi:hypothetical protein
VEEFTVTVIVAEQPAEPPVVPVYEITVVPARIPVTTPVLEMVPATGTELLHSPPGVASVSAAVSPTHTVLGPTMGAGSESTVIVTVDQHPLGTVYDITEAP